MPEVVAATDKELGAAIVGRLGILSAVRRGLPQYYQLLLQESDIVLRVAALVALLELRAIWSDQAELVAANSRHGAVKRRAFPFFLDVHELEFARRVAETPSEDVGALLRERMRAELALDYRRIVDLDLQLYLEHGTADYLWDAENSAEALGGWRTGIPVSVTALLARPADADASLTLLNRLRTANQRELLARVCDSFSASGIFQAETAVFRAAILLDSGEGDRAAAWLERMPEQFPSEHLTKLVLQLKAEALNKLGNYRAAYAAFGQMNAVGRSQKVDPRTFPADIRRRAAFAFDPLPSDPREYSCLTLTGFPRSATTLLENVLEAHPDIEAFEEIPAFFRMATLVDRYAAKQGKVTIETAEKARNAYYDDLRRYAKKPEAKWRVDKLPANSAEAVFLKQIFPEKRYIFSIRHPFDVVLSCFRQNFTTNAAMENFRTIRDASALYDFAMTQWFNVHSLEDPTVCYVRYEDLVNDFRPAVERVLGFIGTEWDDAILGFAQNAERRFAKTPSYQKVRSGIKIGVQSSWQNYEFLWHTKETAVLNKWVEHFGYS